MTQTSVQVLREGRASLLEALRDLGIAATESGLYWLLGQAYAESGLGYGDMSHMPSAKQFANTNNWGAVYWPGDPPKKPNPYTERWTDGTDANPGGTPWKTKIAVYPDQVSGAKGFLTIYQRRGVDVLGPISTDGATASDLSRGLYKHGYYTGCHLGLDGAPSLNRGTVLLAAARALKAKVDADPNHMVSCVGRRRGAALLHDTQAEADAANIAEYAQMIANGATMARKAVGAPAAPSSPATPPSPSPVPPLVIPGALPSPVSTGPALPGVLLAGIAVATTLGYWIWKHLAP